MIIGITGKKRSGKDTIADYLFDNYSFIKMAIADPMKEACRHIFLMSKDQLWGDKKDVIDERYNTTPRKILQTIGLELFQHDIYNYIEELDEKIPRKTLWINRFRLEYEEKLKERGACLKVVISDVRFTHEANAIKKLGGYILRVLRPGLNQDDDHVSEREMDNFKTDGEINNIGDFKLLYQQIDQFLKEKGLIK